MRRWTGFSPSRTSGSARPTITLIAYSMWERCSSSSIGWGETRGRDSWASSGMVLLDVQVHDFLRVLLDVLPARLDGLPHEDREQGIGGRGVLNRDLLQQAAGGIHRRLPELVGV